MRPEFDNVIRCLSLNGYSVFSLINDILANGGNREDQRIKSLRVGVERDAADICALLLNHNSASALVSTWALGFAQSMLRSKVEEITRKEDGLHFMARSLPNGDVISPGLSFGTASTTTNDPKVLCNIGRARCTCSSSAVPPMSADSELRTQLWNTDVL